MDPEDSAYSNLILQSEIADKSESSNYLFNPRDINCSEGNKHPHIFPEPSGRSGTSEHLEKHPEVTARIGRNDYFDLNAEVFGGNKSRYHPEVVDGSGGHEHSEIHSSITNVIDSSEHMVIHPGNPFYQSDLFSPTKKLRSISSSSSSVSSEDLFQVDTKGLRKSKTSFKAEEGTQPASNDYRNDDFSSNIFNTSELKNASPGPPSTSQVSQVTHELTIQSPTIQVMDRSGRYDPLRIPSSIFESDKSTTPLDWSAASNESLFSIQIGNNSFNRELTLGSELFKSEELTKSSELLVFSPSPSVPVMETDKKSVELEKGGATGESDERIKDTTRATAESQSKEKPPPAAVSLHSRSNSDGSVTSSCSFAFPIKKKKKNKCACITIFCCRKKCRRKKCAWPSCYCSNCSCTFCYCTWPSCCCSNCSWAFCYCWNCSKKRWCCHSSIILTDGLKSASVKVDAEKQQQQSMALEVTSKSTGCSWFRCCFSPCPSCCHFRYCCC
ncbi:hypothetical protein ACOSQ3_018097 [Xanthoceras sorbifolium]